MTEQSYLKLLGLSIYATLALGLLAWTSMATADDSLIIYQPEVDSPIEARNINGPAELAQYDFLIGDWDVDITWYFPGQDPTKNKAKWHNHWVVDGQVVMLEWRGEQFTGAELRQWHPGQKKWVGVNIYPDFGGGMTPVTAEKMDETMLVFMDVQTQEGGYINRETYYDIEVDSYKMKSDHSYDDGETWERGLYEMTVWRSK